MKLELVLAMTIYSEKNATSLLSGSFDAEGNSISVRRVNGNIVLTWPLVLDLPSGRVSIQEDGLVTYNDLGDISGHPSTSTSQSNGSFSYTLWDGQDESPVYTASISLNGLGSSVDFGALTGPGAGGIPVPASAITSGNEQNHFEISAGHIVPTSAGSGSLAGSYALGLDSGHTTYINVVPNAAHVINASQLGEAVSNARGPVGSGQHFQILLRDGSVIGATNEQIAINDIQGNGSLVDPNVGASDNAYDNGATADFSGGRLTIRAETPLGAEIAGRVNAAGCDRLIFKDIDFTTHLLPSDPIGYYYSDNPTGNSGNNPDYANTGLNLTSTALFVTSNGSYSTRGTVIVDGCRFGAPLGIAAGHFASGLRARFIDTIIVQNCDFRRVFRGFWPVDVDRVRAVNCLFKDYLEDAVQSLNQTEPGSIRLEITDSYILNAYDGPAHETFSGAHKDGIQYGTGADNKDYHLVIQGNYMPMLAPGSVAGVQNAPIQGGTINHQKHNATQGLFTNFQSNNTTKVTGVVRNNFVIVSSTWGINVDNGSGMNIEANTVVRDKISIPESPYGNAKARIYVTTGGGQPACHVHKCVTQEFAAYDGTTYADNMVNFDWAAQLGAPSITNAADDIFEGTFSAGGNGYAQYSIDLTDRATTKNTIDAVFATKSTGLGNGRGHLA